MKKISIALASLLAVPVTAAVGEPELELKGYLSSWTQECSGAACALPVPGERNVPVTLRLALPSSAGEASAAHAAKELATAGGGISADLDFYAICPYVGRAACAGRYFQAQVRLSGPAGAFCASALNAADFAPFPVVMCAGALPGGRRFGVTLHRQPL